MIALDDLRALLAARNWQAIVALKDEGAAEVLAYQGDVVWLLVHLDDGRWAALDNAELAPDRIRLYPSRRQAVREERRDFVAAHPEFADPDYVDPAGYADWVAVVAR